MKRQWLVAIAALISAGEIAKADLIPLGDESVYYNTHYIFFDEARSLPYTLYDATIFPSGWVSRFGALNGGVYFQTDIINNPVPVSRVSWDFSGTNFWLSAIDTWGPSGENVFAVPWDERFAGTGIVYLDGNITSEAFYGLDLAHVPESGSTLTIFGIACAFLIAFSTQITRKAGD